MVDKKVKWHLMPAFGSHESHFGNTIREVLVQVQVGLCDRHTLLVDSNILYIMLKFFLWNSCVFKIIFSASANAALSSVGCSSTRLKIPIGYRIYTRYVCNHTSHIEMCCLTMWLNAKCKAHPFTWNVNYAFECTWFRFNCLLIFSIVEPGMLAGAGISECERAANKKDRLKWRRTRGPYNRDREQTQKCGWIYENDGRWEKLKHILQLNAPSVFEWFLWKILFICKLDNKQTEKWFER